jgi:hypothetical protein
MTSKGRSGSTLERYKALLAQQEDVLREFHREDLRASRLFMGNVRHEVRVPLAAASRVVQPWLRCRTRALGSGLTRAYDAVQHAGQPQHSDGKQWPHTAAVLASPPRATSPPVPPPLALPPAAPAFHWPEWSDGNVLQSITSGGFSKRLAVRRRRLPTPLRLLCPPELGFRAVGTRRNLVRSNAKQTKHLRFAVHLPRFSSNGLFPMSLMSMRAHRAAHHGTHLVNSDHGERRAGIYHILDRWTQWNRGRLTICC